MRALFRRAARGVTTRRARLDLPACEGESMMPAIDEDDRPKKKIAHEIGQDLTLLSVEELAERIALLKEEIARLEADMTSKQATRAAADQFFKR